MRFIIIVLICVGFNLFGCDLGALSPMSSANNNGCADANFKPKTEGEIAVMTPRQLFDERVKKEICRDTFNSFFEWADYGILIDKYIRRSGVNMLPVLTEHLNSYDPKNESECESMRFSMASFEANELDRFVFRLRGSKEGQLTIAALERAVDRMKEAGFDDKKRDYDDNRRFRIDDRHLGDLKGVNEVDRNVQDTFWVKRKITMSDDELLEFSNFLVSRDPTYPAWSDTDFIKDFSRINEAGSPAQVHVMNEPKCFYEAYLEFKRSKK